MGEVEAGTGTGGIGEERKELWVYAFGLDRPYWTNIFTNFV